MHHLANYLWNLDTAAFHGSLVLYMTWKKKDKVLSWKKTPCPIKHGQLARILRVIFKQDSAAPLACGGKVPIDA